MPQDLPVDLTSNGLSCIFTPVLPPYYRTGVVARNARLTTDQADVMMVVGNGR
jgi:hypothetical protein